MENTDKVKKEKKKPMRLIPILERFEKSAKKYPHPNEIVSERELMEYAESVLKSGVHSEN